jgi:hypothetical protein
MAGTRRRHRRFIRKFVMSHERRVAVLAGASQGIGASLVRGFFERGYRVVANSWSIKPDASADVLAVACDITMKRAVSGVGRIHDRRDRAHRRRSACRPPGDIQPQRRAERHELRNS